MKICKKKNKDKLQYYFKLRNNIIPDILVEKCTIKPLKDVVYAKESLMRWDDTVVFVSVNGNFLHSPSPNLPQAYNVNLIQVSNENPN